MCDDKRNLNKIKLKFKIYVLDANNHIIQIFEIKILHQIFLFSNLNFLLIYRQINFPCSYLADTITPVLNDVHLVYSPDGLSTT